jgi:glycerol-3-phosphate dehydrogenase (NAD(P)+)
MANILVLGAGVMGSAITVPLTDAGHVVRLVGTHLDAELIASIRQARFHPRLRSHLPESVAPYTNDQLGEAMHGADLVFLGVNSEGLDWAAERLRATLPPRVPVILLTKGLRGNGKSIEILPRVLEARLRTGQRGGVCGIGGPSIAGELAARRQTSVVLAGPDQALVDRLSECVRTPYYHVWPSIDLVGVEVCAALKNLFALGVGTVAGLLERSPAVKDEVRMHNPASALFAQALWEMEHVVARLGGRKSTVRGLAGAGDLYVTCQAGRNCRMGRWLGLGMRYSEAKARHMSEDTVEGAETAAAIRATVDAMIDSEALDGVVLPLMTAIMDMVCNDGPVDIRWDRFFAERARSIPQRRV